MSYLVSMSGTHDLLHAPPSFPVPPSRANNAINAIVYHNTKNNGSLLCPKDNCLGLKERDAASKVMYSRLSSSLNQQHH